MTEHDRQERTDDLETTIHSIESLQQTGVLSLVRAKGGVRETAHLVFLEGQVVEASVGNRIGQDALNWIFTWGSCRYTFNVKFSSEIVVPAPSLPTVDETSNATSPLSFISQVVQKYTQTSNAAQSAREIPLERPVEEASSTPTCPLPRTPFPAAYPFNPSTPIPPLPSIPIQQVEMTRLHAPFRLFNGSEAVDYMERFGLSRLHRHVFFLLDGQRTAVDVVRLTGRSFYEIQRLLADLERLGLIRKERASVSEGMDGM